MAHVVNDRFLTTKYRIDSRPVHVGYVVDKTTRGLIFFSKYFGFPVSSFYECSTCIFVFKILV